MALIRTLRPLNLLIIVLTMLLLEYFLIGPVLRTLPFHESDALFHTPRLHFYLLILSTVLIAGAGNIINDYFDLRADRVNKPDKILIGRKIERRTAMLTHFLLNACALLIAAWISWKNWVWAVLLLQLFAAAVLWFYSLFLKHQPLIGNLMVALITGLIPIMLLLFELPPLLRSYAPDGELYGPVRDAIIGGEDPSRQLYIILYWTLGYGGFAFITTLIREIQKDLADKDGDKKVGSQTLPLAIGEARSRTLIGVLVLLFIGGLGFSWYIFLGDASSLTYIIVAIMVPASISAAMVFGNGSRKSYLRASDWMKLTMLMGVLFIIFAHFIGPEKIFFP